MLNFTKGLLIVNRSVLSFSRVVWWDVYERTLAWDILAHTSVGLHICFYGYRSPMTFMNASLILCLYGYWSMMMFMTLWLHVVDDVCDSVSMVTCRWWRLWLCFYGYMSLMTFVTLFLWLHVVDDVCDSVSMVTGRWWHLWLFIHGYRSLMTFVTLFLWLQVVDDVCNSVSMVTGLWWRLWTRGCWTTLSSRLSDARRWRGAVRRAGSSTPTRRATTRRAGALQTSSSSSGKSQIKLYHFYRLLTKFVEGNVFTGVCLCGGGRV